MELHIVVFFVKKTHNMVGGHRRFGGTVSTFRDGVLSYGCVFDDGGNMFLQHADNNLPDDTTSQPTENVN